MVYTHIYFMWSQINANKFHSISFDCFSRFFDCCCFYLSHVIECHLSNIIHTTNGWSNWVKTFCLWFPLKHTFLHISDVCNECSKHFGMLMFGVCMAWEGAESFRRESITFHINFTLSRILCLEQTMVQHLENNLRYLTLKMSF